MQEKITLEKIIKEVLEDHGEKDSVSYEANMRRVRRAFDILIERLGSNKEALKHGGKNIEFKESEKSFMKVIISQLYDNEGIVAEFVNERNRDKTFSSKDVRKLIQALIDEADKTGMNELELIYLAQFFSNIFLISPLRSIEYCHTLIDYLALNLQDLTYSEQAEYLQRVEWILKKEFAIRCAELTLNIEGLGMLIEEKRKLVGDDIYSENFYEYDEEIRYEYIQRDKEVIKRIQEDDDLRQYIEKKFGKRAEEIFNYAVLDM